MLPALTAAALLMCTPAHGRSTPEEAAYRDLPPPDGVLDTWPEDAGGFAEQAPAPPAGSSPSPTRQPSVSEPQAPAAAPVPAPPEDAVEDTEGEGIDDFSLGDIPVVETVELTVDQAKRAIDAYVLVSEKYKDAELENYENLQDFVDQAPQGKAFEADIKAAGFATVNEWNTAITTLSFALANLGDDQTADIRQQIEEIKADTEMAQDMRERMIAALGAMIPSENNKKVIAELAGDRAYAEKLRQLETDEVE